MLFSLLTDKEQKQSSRNRCGTDIAESGKKSTLLTILLLAVNCSLIIAQSPQAFKYQAVVRDTGGLLIANQVISIRAAIVKDSANGTVVYQETHAVNSNEFGLISLEIGNGTTMIGAFEDIDWSAGHYFIKIEMDPDLSLIHI